MASFTFYTELALGATLTGSPNSWSWTDATQYVGLPGITIRRARGDRYSEASPDTCSLTFLNNNGRFVPRNPLSPYYGQLKRGTPLRVLIRPNVNSASDTFNRTVSSSWGSADVGGAWTNVTGGGIAASDYSVSPTNGGRHLHTAASLNHWSDLNYSLQRVDIQVRVRVNATSTGAAQSAGVFARYTGPGDNRRAEIQFGTAGTLTARLVSLTASVESVDASATVTGLTHSTSTWYRIRVQTGLTSVRMKVWTDGTTEPAGWLLDGAAAGIWGSPVNGRIGCYSRRETGNTNANATMDFDDFSMVDGPRIQFTGFVDAWPVTWGDASLSQSYAPITASGQLRRLGRTQPLKSLLYMTLSTASGVVGYWPMEDGSSATSFASGLSGGSSGNFFTSTSLTLAGDSNVAGSDPLPTLSGTGRTHFPVPSYTSSGTWAVAWVMKIPASSLSGGNAQVMSWITPNSSIFRWVLTLIPGSPDTLRLDALSSGGTTSGGTINLADSSSSAELTNGRQLYIVVTGTQNGGNVDTTVDVWYLPDDGGSATATGRVDSFAGTTGYVSYIYHDASQGFANGGHTIGQLALGDGDLNFGAGATGVTGGAGDTTRTRFDQLLDTQGITSFFGDLIRGTGTTDQLMGPQRSGDILSQLREVEATELGVMYDSKQGYLHLLPRDMRYNRPIDLTLNVASGQVGWPFGPVEDDYLLRNDVTVANVGGSSVRSTDADSIASQGVHADNVQVNIYKGSNLRDHADWRKNLGIREELRYPSIVVDLTRNYLALASSWCDTDIGSRIQVTNVPHNELPPETLDLVVDGYTEVISSTEWRAELNCSPGGQWLVEQLDSDRRLDCGASTTVGSLTTSATAVTVSAGDACTWTHSRGDFGILVGGERMTVTAVNNAVTDTYTRSVSSGWGTADSGQSWTIGGGSASDYGVGSGRGNLALTTVTTVRTAYVANVGPHVDVTVLLYPTVVAVGAQFEQRVRVRHNGSTYYETLVQYQTSGQIDLYLQRGVTVLASLGSALAYGAATVVGVHLQAIGSTIRHRIWDAANAEPLGWIHSVVDSTLPGNSTDLVMLAADRISGNTQSGLVVQFDNLTVTNPQTLTVTRSVNGITKSHSSGVEVHVADPIILGL